MKAYANTRIGIDKIVTVIRELEGNPTIIISEDETGYVIKCEIVDQEKFIKFYTITYGREPNTHG